MGISVPWVRIASSVLVLGEHIAIKEVAHSASTLEAMRAQFFLEKK
jgi:hypothetical protein